MAFRFTPPCCCEGCVTCAEMPDADKISTSVYTSFANFESVVKSQPGQDCQYGYIAFYGEEYYNPADFSLGYYNICGNVESAVPFMRYNQNAPASQHDRAYFPGLTGIRSCYGAAFTSSISYGNSKTLFDSGSTKTFLDGEGHERIFESGYQYYSVYDFESPEPQPNIITVKHADIHYKWSLCKNVAYHAASDTPVSFDGSSLGLSYYLPVQSTSVLRYGLDPDGLICSITRIEAKITRWDTTQGRERGFYAVWLCPMQTYEGGHIVYYDSTGSYNSSQKDTLTAEDRLRELLNGSYIDDTLPEGHQTVTVRSITGIQWLIPIAVESETDFTLNTVLNPNKKYTSIPEGATYLGTFYSFRVNVNINGRDDIVVIKYDTESDTAAIQVLDHIVRAETVGEIGNLSTSSDLSGMTFEELTQPPNPSELINYTPPVVSINSYKVYYLYEREEDAW